MELKKIQEHFSLKKMDLPIVNLLIYSIMLKLNLLTTGDVVLKLQILLYHRKLLVRILMNLVVLILMLVKKNISIVLLDNLYVPYKLED
jgi:hypothetical protein